MVKGPPPPPNLIAVESRDISLFTIHACYIQLLLLCTTLIRFI